VLITISAVDSSDVCVSVVVWYVLWVPNVFLMRCAALDRSSIPVDLLLVFDVCAVICGVFSVLSLLFFSSSCCLCGDLSLLGFDRAMFVEKIK
jgi:hypothetical protein